MDPVQFKRILAQPKMPDVTGPARKRLNQELPEWDFTQQDLSKHKLSEAEVQLRKEARKPRPRNQQPIIGDKYLQVRTDEASTDEEQDKLIQNLINKVKSNTQSNVNTQRAKSQPHQRLKVQNKLQTKKQLPKENLQTQKIAAKNNNSVNSESQSSQEDLKPPEVQKEHVPISKYSNFNIQQKMDFLSEKQIDIVQQLIEARILEFQQKYDGTFNEIFLGQINNLNQQVADLSAQNNTLQQQIANLLTLTQQQQQRILRLEGEMKIYDQYQKIGEFQQMEDILDRLKFM